MYIILKYHNTNFIRMLMYMILNIWVHLISTPLISGENQNMSYLTTTGGRGQVDSWLKNVFI